MSHDNKDCCKVHEVVPTLTYAAQVVEDQGGDTWNAVSADGSKVFTVYVRYVTSPLTTIAAELFQNTNGILQSIGTVPVNAPFTNIETGAANNSYTLFAVGVTDPNNSGGKIDFYDSSLALANTILIPDYVGFDKENFIVGNFTSDDRFINVNYLVSLSPDATTPALARLDVYDVTVAGGLLVARVEYETTSNGGQFFDLNGKTYLAFPYMASSFVNPTGSDITFLCPAFLDVFLFQPNSLQPFKGLLRVAHEPLPSFPRDISVKVVHDKCKEKDKALIAVICRLAVESANLPNVRTDTSGFLTCTPGDTDQLRVYKFKGCGLDLVASHQIQTDVNGVEWVGQTNILVISLRASQSNAPGVAYFLELVEKCGKKHREKKCCEKRCDCAGDNRRASEKTGRFINVDFSLVTPPFAFSPYLSADGRWMLISGADTFDMNNFTFYHLDINTLKYRKFK